MGTKTKTNKTDNKVRELTAAELEAMQERVAKVWAAEQSAEETVRDAAWKTAYVVRDAVDELTRHGYPAKRKNAISGAAIDRLSDLSRIPDGTLRTRYLATMTFPDGTDYGQCDVTVASLFGQLLTETHRYSMNSAAKSALRNDLRNGVFTRESARVRVASIRAVRDAVKVAQSKDRDLAKGHDAPAKYTKANLKRLDGMTREARREALGLPTESGNGKPKSSVKVTLSPDGVREFLESLPTNLVDTVREWIVSHDITD